MTASAVLFICFFRSTISVTVMVLGEILGRMVNVTFYQPYHTTFIIEEVTALSFVILVYQNNDQMRATKKERKGNRRRRRKQKTVQMR